MRRGKNDWFEAGFELLKSEGAEGLTLERLCKEMGLTRGSFYHHFEGIPEYKQALLAHWQQTYTHDILATLPVNKTAQDTLNVLSSRVQAGDQRIGRVIRAWAMVDAEVDKAVQQVDAIRLEVLTQFHVEASDPQPDILAEVEYALFTGMQALGWTQTQPERCSRLIQTLQDAMRKEIKR